MRHAGSLTTEMAIRPRKRRASEFFPESGTLYMYIKDIYSCGSLHIASARGQGKMNLHTHILYICVVPCHVIHARSYNIFQMGSQLIWYSLPTI